MSNIDSTSQKNTLLMRIKENPRLWQGKFSPAFWTFTGTLSLVVNLILVVILIFLGRELFALKALVSEQLIGGLLV